MPTLPTDLKDQSVREVILLTAYWLFTNDFYFLMVAVRERPVEKVGGPHWEWSNYPSLSRSTRYCKGGRHHWEWNDHPVPQEASASKGSYESARMKQLSCTAGRTSEILWGRSRVLVLKEPLVHMTFLFEHLSFPCKLSQPLWLYLTLRICYRKPLVYLEPYYLGVQHYSFEHC